MKWPIIFLTMLFPAISGCSVTKNTADTKNMIITSATYDRWSEPPPAGSDIPERGVDLTLTIQSWPQGYQPNHIIYHNLKSYNASIADSSANRVIIEARIIRASSVMTETTSRVEQSDRLVFNDSDGAEGFIEIHNWQRAER